MGKIQQILNTSNKLNILCAATHESFESMLAKTGHNFYAINTINHIKNWDTKYRPLPDNYILLDCRNDIKVPKGVEFDLVLSQQKFSQYQTLSPIAQQLGLPLCSLEHTVPPPGSDQWTAERTRMRGKSNVFITEYSVPKWGFKLDDPSVKVIHHAIDSDLFKSDIPIVDRQRKVLTVGNDIINRDWCLNFRQQQKVTNGLPHTHVGDTPGYSLPAKNTEELVEFYSTSRVFLNTHHVSPIPTSLLEAASCGCACVSCKTCGIPEFFTHGHDILFAESDEEMQSHLVALLQDNELATRLGENARKTIEQKCSIDRFVNDWNTVFNSII